MPEAAFDAVMLRLKEGDQEAATHVFNRFAYRLIALARTRLDVQTRQKVDPEDCVQSAYKSFFVRYADGQFDLQNWDNLWTILTVITLRKCGHRVEYFHARCRDVGREIATASDANDSRESWEAVSRDPTPSEAAMLSETLERIMSELNERERQILTLSLQGYDVPEISEQVGRSERTIRRVLERVRAILEQLRDQD